MKTFRLYFPLICLFILSGGCSGRIPSLKPDFSVRNQLIDDEWLFYFAPDSGKYPNYQYVDLPHDWSIGGNFDRNASSGNDGGYLPTGKGYYSKSFDIKNEDLKNRHIWLYLEGAYMNSIVTIDSDTIGQRPYGYSSIIYDITEHIDDEAPNIMTIEVDNSKQKNCRWYSGSGLYRHVHLINTSDTPVLPWSVFVTTPRVSKDNSDVCLTFKLGNFSTSEKKLMTRANVINKNGDVVEYKDIIIDISPDSEEDVQFNFFNLPLSLWSPDSPELYSMRIDILSDDKVVDSVTESFGARVIEYSADKGFLLNGSPILINGGCVHHDHGMLGAASYDAAEARKVRLLKEGGFNAVRTSHNPPSPAFLDECDRQGILVIDEVFDGWRTKKTKHDFAESFDDWWEKEIESMVLRDRNHPSVICWSIGNEIIERKSKEAVTTAAMLASKCRTLDPSRPVTSALASWDADWEIYDSLAAVHDIVGYNYMIHKAEGDHLRVPQRIIWQTESYPKDAFSNWLKVNNYPYIIGDFVWTAIDYLGESGIGRHYYDGDSEGEHFHRDQWPWHGALCGDIDIIGGRKPISFYRQMLYSTSDTTIYMAVKEPDGYKGRIHETMWGTYPTVESWNWNGHEGKPIEIVVYSKFPAVRLYTDGKMIGQKSNSIENEFVTKFVVPYSPGRIEARGVDENGNETSYSYAIETSGKPFAIRLSADKDVISPDNQDLIFISAEVVDSIGRVVPNANNAISFESTGKAGKLKATGSADMKDSDSYRLLTRKAFNGRAAAVVKSTKKAGKVTVKVTSPGLKSDELVIYSR